MKPEKTFIFSSKNIRENPLENNFKVTKFTYFKKHIFIFTCSLTKY